MAHANALVRIDIVIVLQVLPKLPGFQVKIAGMPKSYSSS